MSRKRVPLNQNECTDDFRIGVPFERDLHFESNLFKENNSQTRLYYTSMLDYHLVFCETKEPPSAEQYARQCKRSANQLMISLLVLYFQYENNYDTYYH